MASLAEENTLVEDLNTVHQGFMVATALCNILFSQWKRGTTPVLPFLRSFNVKESLNSADVAIALLDVISQLDLHIEKLISFDARLSRCYHVKNSRDVATTETLDKRVETILHGLLSTQHTTAVLSEMQVKEKDHPRCMEEYFEKLAVAEQIKVMGYLMELSWLCQSLVNSILGLQNSDIQKYDNRIKQQYNIRPCHSKQTKLSSNTSFSSTVLQLLASTQPELKILFCVGLPRCLRLRTIMILWCQSLERYRVPLYQHVMPSATECPKDPFNSKKDLNVFNLAYLLSQLGLVILVDDISSNLVRYAALSGLHLLAALPHNFSTVLLLMGLQKSQLDGSFSRETKRVYSKSKGMITLHELTKKSTTSHEYSYLFGSLVGVTLKKKKKTTPPTNSIMTPPHSGLESSRYKCSKCESQWFPSSSLNKRSFSSSFSLLCPFCQEPITGCQDATWPRDMFPFFFNSPNETNQSVILANLPLSYLVHHQLDNLSSRIFGVSQKISHQLSLETLDAMNPPFLVFKDESSSPATSLKDTFEGTDSWTLPAHGWLLRALDEASDANIRQACLDAIAQILSSHPNDSYVPEFCSLEQCLISTFSKHNVATHRFFFHYAVRFRVHLPLLRSLFDPDSCVSQSAMECVVIASQLSPLKDGAAHRLVTFLTSCCRNSRALALFQLIERCSYYDASALKALVKGMAQALYSSFTTTTPMRFPFSSFFLAIDKTLPKDASDESNFFFWPPSSWSPHGNSGLTDVHLECLSFLKTCYIIGRRHFLELIPFYDSQKCVTLDPFIFKTLQHTDSTTWVELSSSHLDVLALICFMLGAGLQYSAQIKLDQPHVLKNWTFVVCQESPPHVPSCIYQWVQFYIC